MAQNNPDLPAKQQQAVELLVSGKTMTAVAAELGVGRRTLFRWRTTDSRFAAALALRRQELRDSARDGLLSLTHQAIDVLREKLDAGNERVAFYVLDKATSSGLKVDDNPAGLGVVEDQDFYGNAARLADQA